MPTKLKSLTYKKQATFSHNIFFRKSFSDFVTSELYLIKMYFVYYYDFKKDGSKEEKLINHQNIIFQVFISF